MRRAWTALALNAAAGLAALLFCLPFVQMLLNAFKSNDEIMSNPGGVPQVWTWSSFLDLAAPHRSLLRNLANSILIAGSGTVLAVVLCAAAGFAFAKLRFAGRDLIFTVLLVTMMVPPEVVYPGQFLLFSRLGLIDTLAVQVLPTITPVFGLFLVRQYMLSIPDELIDRPKQGFGVPVYEWFFDRLGDQARRELASFCDQTDFLDRDEVMRIVDSRSSDAWYLLNFALWWKEFVA